MRSIPGNNEHAALGPRKQTFHLALLLYLATISIAAVRKATGLPTGTDSVIYLIVGVMYFFLLPGIRNYIPTVPRYLPVWLTLLTFWCLTEAFIPRIPL